jgi:LuxR family maltose regulon positive regulatory protein
MLESLERANLFLVPLDAQRQWYRYHHLFGDVLEAHLRHEHPEEVAGLHLRASGWYAESGQPIPAVRHALAAGEVDRAADLAEAALPALQRDRQEAVIHGWIRDFPDDVVRDRPVLAIGLVGALMSSNEFADVEQRLQGVERQLPAIEARIAAGDDGDLARVPSGVELYRAGMALVTGDLGSTHRHAQHAIDTSMPDDDLVRAAASGLSGLAHWACGELDDAHARYLACIDGLRRAGHVSDVLGCSITLSDIRMAQGRLRDARASFDDGLRLAGTTDNAPRGVADMHVGLSQMALEGGLLAESREHLDVARSLGEERGLPQLPYRLRTAAAMLAAADGDLAAALSLVTDAQRVYLGDFSPDVRPLHAVAARLLVRLDDVEAAEAWVREHGVTSTQEPSYLREFEHVTLAEVLLARHRRAGGTEVLDEVDHLLEGLRQSAHAGGRAGSVLDTVILQAVAAQARGDVELALARLGEAVGMAERQGQVLAFARHGDLLVPLLEELIRQAGAVPWTATLLGACRAASETATAVGPETPVVSATIVEALSARELEVLHLLGSELGGPEIAAHLFVSLNTLRTHTKSIYTKLGVNNRRAAVRRGGELGLLTGR